MDAPMFYGKGYRRPCLDYAKGEYRDYHLKLKRRL